MNKVSFKKLDKTKMKINNIFSNYISCIFNDNVILYYSDIRNTNINVSNPYHDYKSGIQIVLDLRINKYENYILLFDTDHILFICIKEPIKHTYLTWRRILFRFIQKDELFCGCEEKRLLYKIKNNILKL